MTDYKKLEALQKFMQRLNSEPPAESIDKTADGKARTVTISHVEMTLDELYFGLWETVNFTTEQLLNEVVGHLELVVTHPITGEKIHRTGAGAVVITQQRDTPVADFLQYKQKNALDLTYPKLKAECLKNAAQSLGKIFGRDLNRRNADQFKPILSSEALQKKLAEITTNELPSGLTTQPTNETLLNAKKTALKSIKQTDQQPPNEPPTTEKRPDFL